MHTKKSCLFDYNHMNSKLTVVHDSNIEKKNSLKKNKSSSLHTRKISCVWLESGPNNKLSDFTICNQNNNGALTKMNNKWMNNLLTQKYHVY